MAAMSRTRSRSKRRMPRRSGSRWLRAPSSTRSSSSLARISGWVTARACSADRDQEGGEAATQGSASRSLCLRSTLPDLGLDQLLQLDQLLALEPDALPSARGAEDASSIAFCPSRSPRRWSRSMGCTSGCTSGLANQLPNPSRALAWPHRVIRPRRARGRRYASRQR